MGKNWMAKKKRDYFYRKAKKEGYRSRAAYKLMQINDRYRVVKPGYVVIELGASPGGWTQVLREATGDDGLVIAVDIARMAPIDGVVIIRGDMLRPETQDRIMEVLRDRGIEKVDAVVSDMSPNISGAYDWDHARSLDLAEKALSVAERFLRPGGDFLVKVFYGRDIDSFLKKVRARFDYVKITHPPASRKSSSEVYVIGKRYKFDAGKNKKDEVEDSGNVG